MNKTTFIGIILLSLGSVFAIIQSTFYGYIDEGGIVHDSIFLPLGSGFLVLGITFLFLGLIATKIGVKKNTK